MGVISKSLFRRERMSVVGLSGEYDMRVACVGRGVGGAQCGVWGVRV